PGRAEAFGRLLADATFREGRRPGDAGRQRGRGLGGGPWQEAGLSLRAWAAEWSVGEDQEPPQAGPGDRRMDRGRRQARWISRRAAGGLLRQGQVRVRRQGRNRLLGFDAREAERPDEAAGTGQEPFRRRLSP